MSALSRRRRAHRLSVSREAPGERRAAASPDPRERAARSWGGRLAGYTGSRARRDPKSVCVCVCAVYIYMWGVARTPTRTLSRARHRFS